MKAILFDWVAVDKDGIHLWSGSPDWSESGMYWCEGTESNGHLSIGHREGFPVPVDHKQRIDPIVIELIDPVVSSFDSNQACDD